MRRKHAALLRCPKTGNMLVVEAEIMDGERIRSGKLLEPTSGNCYPIVNFIPRFVPLDNYANNFGLEWNIHSRTQYDDTSKFSVSKERFQKETKWGTNLKGEIILEAGSGSGRFTTHAGDTGATVVSFDYSNAVEANYNSNGQRDNILILQASIYEMPFEKEFFDRAFCFGVLQHTPDPRNAIRAIVDQIKPGGYIATDVYVKDLRHWLLQTKYYVRPFTRGRNPEALYGIIRKYVNIMWPLSRLIRKIPKFGYAINWRLLVADYSKLLPNADDKTLKEWAYLDTFDMLSPMFDYPQTMNTFRKWHIDAGLTDIDIHYGYNGIEGRARKANLCAA